MNDEKSFVNFKNENEKTTYTHLLLELRNINKDPDVTMQSSFGYMFVDGVLPKEGDKIEFVCTKSDEESIEINMKVVPKEQ